MGIIRLFLAVIVINSHYDYADWSLITGHEAVQCFFVISGFYMALVLDRKYTDTLSFYRGRFNRLFPMYAVALFLSLFLLFIFDMHYTTTRAQMLEMLQNPIAAITMAWWSFIVVGQELIFTFAPVPPDGLAFVGNGYHSLWEYAPLIQTWSLSLEIVFYALAPFLVRLRTNVLFMIALASLLLNSFVWWYFGHAQAIFFKRFAPTELWLFVAGIISYRLYRRLGKERSRFDMVFFFCLVGVVGCLGFQNYSWHRPLELAFLLVVAMPFCFRAFWKSEADQFWGRVTYPLYLLHLFVLTPLEKNETELPFIVVVLVCVVLSMAAHLFIELRLERCVARQAFFNPLRFTVART